MHQTIIFSRPQWSGMNLKECRVSSLAMGIWDGTTEGAEFLDVEVSQDWEAINRAAEIAREFPRPAPC